MHKVLNCSIGIVDRISAESNMSRHVILTTEDPDYRLADVSGPCMYCTVQ